MDFGCVRIFPPRFVRGSIELYRALMTDDMARAVAAYEDWGFTGLTHEMIAVLNRWAAFLYGPLMDDRPRRLTEGMVEGHGREMAQNGWRAPPHGRRAAAARVRVHGPRRHRAGRRVHPSQGLDQLAPAVREPDRGFRRRDRPGASRPRSARPAMTVEEVEVEAQLCMGRRRRRTGRRPPCQYGMTFARIDHGAAAAKAGLELRPTIVLIFGNARAGTPLMRRADHRHRSAAEGAGLAGRSGRDVARLQRSGMDLPAPRPGL